jgi:L-fuculose-phosphate aldolase
LKKQLQELARKLAQIAREIYEKRYVAASGGNISTRIPGTNQVIIKPTGMRLKDLTPNNILVVNLDGKLIEGKGEPSKEIRFHIGIYKVREDVGAIIHTHSPAATAFAVLGKSLPLVTAQAKTFLKKIPTIEFAPPGSKKLASLVIETFKDNSIKVALLEKHGSVVVGKDLDEAFNLLDLLEETARIAIFIKELSKI